ncbi:hypothetical protein ACFW9V_15160 [Streptomyces hygroscopicus]|uniref:hypothetical protein n=1 Tax=Streptomyces hygroscopicus TaxID=1912 RepID=UPI0033E15159
MSAKEKNTSSSFGEHPSELSERFGIKAGRFFKLFHVGRIDSPITASVVLLLLIGGCIGAFIGAGRAAQDRGFPQPVCQGFACGALLAAIVGASLIFRAMLRRQGACFPQQGSMPEKPLDWDKPPEKINFVEKNSQKGLPKQKSLVGKQPSKSKDGPRGKKANRK